MKPKGWGAGDEQVEITSIPASDVGVQLLPQPLLPLLCAQFQRHVGSPGKGPRRGVF